MKFLHARPAKLLLISTGNIANAALEAMLMPLVKEIVRELRVHSLVELSSAGIIVRG